MHNTNSCVCVRVFVYVYGCVCFVCGDSNFNGLLGKRRRMNGKGFNKSKRKGTEHEQQRPSKTYKQLEFAVQGNLRYHPLLVRYFNIV